MAESLGGLVEIIEWQSIAGIANINTTAIGTLIKRFVEVLNDWIAANQSIS